MRQVPEVTREEFKSCIEQIFKFNNLFNINSIFNNKKILSLAIDEIVDPNLARINNFAILTQEMIDNTNPDLKRFLIGAEVGDLVWFDGFAYCSMASINVWVEQYKHSLDVANLIDINYVAEAVAMNLIFKYLIKFNMEDKG